MKYIYFLAIIVLLFPGVSFAEHKSVVAGVMVNSDDPNIIGGHEGGCEQVHYHGELNGIPDPAPKGCGHGPVVAIQHGRGTGERIPTAPSTPSEPNMASRFFSWVGSFFSDDTKEAAKNVVDVAAEANGILPPGTVSDLVDITREETPSLMEKADHITEYRNNVDSEEDTLDLYRNPEEGLEEGSLSQKFFHRFNSLTD